MLKINEDKFFADYLSLQQMKNANISNIAAQVRPFAASLGYDEEKTQGLIDYVLKQSGNGLTEEESALLGFLKSYIDDVESPIEESEVAEEVTAEIPVGII